MFFISHCDTLNAWPCIYNGIKFGLSNRIPFLTNIQNKMNISTLRYLSFIGLITLFVTSCTPDESPNTTTSSIDLELEAALRDVSDGVGKDHFVLPKSNDLSAIPQDPKNPLSPVKIELGRRLFHETGIATAGKIDGTMGTFSCASCHFAGAGFQAGRFQGIGEGGMGFGLNGEGRVVNTLFPMDSIDVQPLRSPTAMNTAYQEAMLWNGQFGATGINAGTEDKWPEGTPIATNKLGYQGVEVQAIAGLAVHRLDTENELCVQMYGPLFEAAFTDFPEGERITRETAGLAIAAYERTVMSNQAPFQKWLQGYGDAMNEQEKRGALVFFQEANCATCHNGPALNSMSFHAYGMNDLDANVESVFNIPAADGSRLGRGGFTKDEADNYKFKTPQLYNLANSPFYGHGSTFRSIREVVEYKNNGVAENANVPASQLAAEFTPQNLSEDQIDDLVAFLENSLNDPDLFRYQPSSVASGNCFPNNDEMSRVDIGCE